MNIEAIVLLLLLLITTVHPTHSILATMSTQMKAVVASKFGKPDDVLTVSDIVKPEADNKTLLIKVHACSLSPGDYRALLGDKTIVANPKVWPYIPGGDVCGTVESVPDSCADEFKVGDKVVATWDIFGVGGLGQYNKVNPKKTVKLPEGLTMEEGAALANTASHALLALNKADVKKGERVLVLGGSGGIGTLIVQMLKSKGASYVATTSTDAKLMKELGSDKNIDYTKENWWELKEWKTDKFDCIIDLAEGKKGWNKCTPVLKRGRDGGRFVAVVHQDWHIDGHHIYQIFGMLLPPFGRQLFNMVRWSTPYYRMYLTEPTKETMNEMLEKAAKKEIKTVIDPDSPHSFTTEGVRAAWNKHIDRKGHGKIVITVD